MTGSILEKGDRPRAINQRAILVLSFALGAGLALASASRGANCQAGFHFLTIFIWPRVFGQGLTPIAMRSLDAVLNGAILAALAWVLLCATQRLRKEVKWSGLVALYIAYTLLMFVAFPMKDCL